MLLAAAQVALLLGGAIWLSRAMQSRISREVRLRLAAEARGHATQLAALIEQLNIQSLDVDSPDWPRLQELIERTPISDQGFASVIDSSGRIVSHPLWHTDPAVRLADISEMRLRTQTGEAPLAESGGGGKPDEGVVETATGVQHLAVLDLPGLGGKVVVQQPEAAAQRIIDRFVGMVNLVAVSVAVVVILLSIGATAAILRGYESRLARINEHLTELVERRSQALLKSRSAVIMGLAKLAESRDDETGRHLERIRRYVRVLGSELAKTHPEVDDEFVATVEETSALHDIGKVGVPDDVLLKPGRLTDDERRIIQRHPLIGGDTLLAVRQEWGKDPFLVTACEIIFAHHERWDGTGYPFGLSGDVIPMAARIVAVADVYDALTTQRVYKTGMPHEQARTIIIDGSGSHFDPAVVEAFVRREDDFRRIHEEFEVAR